MKKQATAIAKKEGVAVVLILTALLLPSATLAGNHADFAESVAALVDSGSVMLNTENSRAVFSYNADSRLIPASIIKILSSLVAIDQLSKEYRFSTEFYVDDRNNLLIRGLGDPFLVSEEIAKIADTLTRKGLKRINRILLDDSAFERNIGIPGASNTLNPYDALNGALVINFNTLHLGRDATGRVFSAERETPLTPLAVRKGRLIPAGRSERISLADDANESLQYAGELFRVFLQSRGIMLTTPDIGRGKVSPQWSLYYIHRNGRTLEEMLTGLLKYSNNFIANQIFLAIGALRHGYPANLEKARRVFRSAIRQEFGTDSGELYFDEASGLSRHNAITGKMMMRVLESFRPYSHLLTERDGVLIKSGSLLGVYNYAGYIETKRGLRPFVIMLNQARNNRDKILDVLKRMP